MSKAGPQCGVRIRSAANTPTCSHEGPGARTHRLQFELSTHRHLLHSCEAAGKGLPHTAIAVQDRLGASLQPRHSAAGQQRPRAWQHQLLHSIPVRASNETGRWGRSGASAREPLLPNPFNRDAMASTPNSALVLPQDTWPRSRAGVPGHHPPPLLLSGSGTELLIAIKTFLNLSPKQNELGVFKQKVKIIPYVETSAAARLHFNSNLIYKVPQSSGENLSGCSWGAALSQ